MLFAASHVGHAKNGYFAVGELNGVIVVIFATLGTEGVSIISARPANCKEKEPVGMTGQKFTQADMDAVSDNPDLLPRTRSARWSRLPRHSRTGGKNLNAWPPKGRQED
jgi:hypothetical protein